MAMVSMWTAASAIQRRLQYRELIFHTIKITGVKFVIQDKSSSPIANNKQISQYSPCLHASVILLLRSLTCQVSHDINFVEISGIFQNKMFQIDYSYHRTCGERNT